jgi:hypothetical protein
MKHLNEKGLSMSQAQAISNLCHQNALEIGRKLKKCNNSHESITIRKKVYVEQEGHPLPKDTFDLLLNKGSYHACQAFLMEAIKEKESLMQEAANKPFVYTGDSIEPVAPNYEDYVLLNEVDEDWGWSQLGPAQLAEYYEAEAIASHLGQFIHKGGKLDRLRSALTTNRSLRFISDGEKQYPVDIEMHHTPEMLLELHEQIASAHRKYEQRVNYFKAKVKNLVNEENVKRRQHNADETARITKINTQLEDEYNLARKNHRAAVEAERQLFEAERKSAVGKISALRIKVDPRFQSVIDKFLKEIED